MEDSKLMNINGLLEIKDKLSNKYHVQEIFGCLEEPKVYRNVIFYGCMKNQELKSVIEYLNGDGEAVGIELHSKTNLFNWFDLYKKLGQPDYSYSFHDNLTQFLWTDENSKNVFSCKYDGEAIVNGEELIVKNERGVLISRIDLKELSFNNIMIYV